MVNKNKTVFHITKSLSKPIYDYLKKSIVNNDLKANEKINEKEIAEKFEGGPIGLDTLAAAVSEEKDTIGDVHEPFLIQLGYIKRTPRGRVATRRAYDHFGIKMEEEGQVQKKLF